MEQKLKQGKHLSFTAHVSNRKTLALLDNGSEADLFDYSHARKLNLPTFKLQKSIPLHLGNGEFYRELTEAALIDLHIGDHSEQVVCYLTHIPRYQMILGDPWLRTHNPSIDWVNRSITFSSPQCFEKGCLRHGRPYTKQTGSRAYTVGPLSESPVDVSFVSAAVFYTMARKRSHEGFVLLPRDHEKYFSAATTNAITADDYDRFMKGKKEYTIEELKARIPVKYHSEIEVFVKQDADKLRHHGPEDHQIHLTEGATPPFARNYRPMSAQELDAVKKYIDENLAKNFIRPSSSRAASPILLVRKPGGGIRVCVDYRALNEITIKNRYPIPLISETLDRLSKARIFSKFDIIHAFNRIRMKEGQEWLTAFNTRYGQFEYLVMPFGLCNAPGTFQNYINEAVRDYLDHFCTAYLDDILVYSDTEEQHTEHVLKVLRRLRERNLQLDIDKCEFDVTRIKYLGLIISVNGIEMDPEKVEVIQNWQTPASVKDVLQFTGFTGFYRRFIADYSRITRPLNELSKGETFLSRTGKRKKKYHPFVWTAECQKAFEDLKMAFKSAPILAHFDPDKETWVETDASDFVVAGIISQMHDGILRPVAFFSKKMNPAECNYMIYDKELLAIVRSFETWRPELASVDPAKPVKVYTDHRNLEYFMTTKQLTRRQARWAEFLSEFNFKIMYRPGKQGQKPDSLTRRSQDLPKDLKDDRSREQFQTLLQSHQLDDNVRKALNVLFCVNKAHADSVQAVIPGAPPSIEDIPEDHSQATTTIRSVVAAAGTTTASPPASGDANRDDDLDTTSTLSDLLDTPEGFDVRESPLASDDEQPHIDEEAEQLPLETLIAEAYERDEVVQDIMAAKARGVRRLPRHIMDKGIRLAMGDLTVRDNRLWIDETRLFTPEDHRLRLRILEDHHRDNRAGHPGPKGMHRLLLRNYFWPGMKSDCKRYADNCTTCRRSKARNVKKQGLLQPLPVPQRKWLDITVDYIQDLPPCKRNGRTYRNILIIVDRLTKGRIYEPTETRSMKELLEVMHRRVFCTKGLPRSIVSDRGRSFVSRFWNRYCQRYRVRIKLSSANHPETDGQSEIAVKICKTFLRSYINYTQDDWLDFLPDAEFTANNSVSETTGMTPFFAELGYHPRTGAEPPGIYDGPGRPEIESADQLVNRTEAIREWLQDEIVWAQEEHQRHANKHRQPHPEYRLGDEVYVDARHFAAERPSISLGYKNAGPWPITRIIDNKAYELKLPQQMINDGVTPVFHPWKLHLAPNNPYPGQRREPQPPVMITVDGETEPHPEWQVDCIVDCRETRRLGLQYKATFEGNWDEWNANPPWQPWTDFRNAPEKVLEFHNTHPDKPPPPNFFQLPRQL